MRTDLRKEVRAFQDALLAQRVASRIRKASLRLGSVRKPLYGHTDMNSAYNVDDYPYGRNLRCKIRYWLEMSPSKGFRFVSQTEDPRKLRWNAPKKSTYARFAGAMYLDEKDHVHWTGLSEYSGGDEVLDFVKDFPGADYKLLKPFAVAKIKYLQAGSEGKLVWRINGVPQPVTEEDMGRAKRELDQWEDVLKRIH